MKQNYTPAAFSLFVRVFLFVLLEHRFLFFWTFATTTTTFFFFVIAFFSITMSDAVLISNYLYTAQDYFRQARVYSQHGVHVFHQEEPGQLDAQVVFAQIRPRH